MEVAKSRVALCYSRCSWVCKGDIVPPCDWYPAGVPVWLSEEAVPMLPNTPAEDNGTMHSPFCRLYVLSLFFERFRF